MLISVCPKIFCKTFAGIPDSIHLVAYVCRYGIIMTNGKSQYSRGFLRLSLFFNSFSNVDFQREKCRNKGAVKVKTKNFIPAIMPNRDFKGVSSSW